MTVDKRISYEEQGGVKNYKPSEMVTVPKIAKSSPKHPETELAYITKKEKDLLVKKDIHNSLKGKPNKGPGGIISLNGDFEDMVRGITGADISAAERGEGPRGAMTNKEAQDFRSAAIAAGAGQRVNPGFFDDRNTVSKAELARAKKFAPKAFAKTRGGFGNFIKGGGILGAILGGIGRAFGLGKRYNTPYDRPEFAPGFAMNPPQMQYDVGNELLEKLANEELAKQQSNNLGGGFVTATGPDFNSLLNQNRNTLANVEFNRMGSYLDGVTDQELYGKSNLTGPDFLKSFEGIYSLPEKEDFLGNTSENYKIKSNTISPYQAKSDIAPQFQNLVKLAGMNETQQKMIDSAANMYGKVNPGEKLDATTQQEIFDSVKKFDTKAKDKTFGLFGGQEADPLQKQEYQDYLISQGYI